MFVYACVCVYCVCIYKECKRTIYIIVHYLTQSLLLNTYINVLNINVYYIKNTYILYNIQVDGKQIVMFYMSTYILLF